MSTFAVLATGPSMSQSIADYVRGKCGVVAVSDAYKLAPWADALVSHDAKWWRCNPDARKFAGRKFSSQFVPGVEQIRRQPYHKSDNNSGLDGMVVAHYVLGATRILLCGFDMSGAKGAHYFGEHPKPMTNTPAWKFAQFIGQFDRWRGCEVLNCTPGSALKRFQFADLHEVLHP